MKTLSLMRHAKAEWDSPDGSDVARPLASKGRRAAESMLGQLAAEWQQYLPNLLVSSPAQRAFETAEIIAEGLSLPLQKQPLLYPFDLTSVRQVIAALPARDAHVLLVGHNPGISYLAMQLGAEAVADMPTASVVSLQFDVLNWADVATTSCVAYRFVKPLK